MNKELKFRISEHVTPESGTTPDNSLVSKIGPSGHQLYPDTSDQLVTQRLEEIRGQLKHMAGEHTATQQQNRQSEVREKHI